MEFKFKKIISKTISVIFMILSLFIIILSLHYLVQVKVKNKNFVNIFGYTVLEVKSGSMSKKLLVSDIILVKLINKDDVQNQIKIDDIVTFSEKNHLVTHRVLELNNDDLITKGDANNVADKAISYSNIEGKYLKTIVNKNILKQVILEEKVFIPLILGTMLLIIALSIETKEDLEKEIYGEKRKKIQKGKRFKN